MSLDDEQQRRVQELFDRLKDMELAEALEILHRECGDDAVRDGVSRMLQSVFPTVEDIDKLRQDLADEFEPSKVFPSMPRHIGPYKVLRKLGEGGFGIVYEAEQEKPIRRRVAIKVIKPGMDSHQVIVRFEAERQALAFMDHPHIAKVYGGGLTQNGLPYFVMERIKGEPLTNFCDRHLMSIPDRLRLFIPVCHAVQHAHSKGVIHRDIKPGNILVGYNSEGHPHPTVIDFGVAKAINQRLTEKTLFTTHGQMIGTPEYMSPEQAEMSGVDIDTRTDVYSLGVVLYELLTGLLPFETTELRGKMYGEMQRIIREVSPPRPSARLSSALSVMAQRGSAVKAAKERNLGEVELPRRLRGELDWVAMKCLEKERERRYSTPIALADELEHYLKNEPVSARPPSVSYRFSKLVRRNKGSAIAAVAFVLILLSATAVSVRYSMIADTERAKTLGALESRDRSLREAQEALRTAQQRLNQVHSLVRIYSDYEQQIRRIEGATVARTRLADATIRILDQIGPVMDAEPWVEQELAKGYLTVGMINAVRSEAIDNTVEAFTRARDMFQILRLKDPADPLPGIGETEAIIGLATVMGGQKRSSDAMSLAVEAEQIARSIVAQGDQAHLKDELIFRSMLTQANLELLGQGFGEAQKIVNRIFESNPLVLDGSATPETLDLYADAHKARAAILREQGDMNQAIEEYQSAIEIRRQGVEQNVNDAVLRRGLINDLYSLGRVLAYEGKSPQRAADLYRESLSHAERLRASDPLDGQVYALVLDQRTALTSALRRGGFFEQAQKEADLLLDGSVKYAAKDPLDRLRQRRVASAQFEQARVLYNAGMSASRDPERYDQGLSLLDQAAAVFSKSSSFYLDLISNSPLGTYDKFRIEAAEVELQHGYTIDQLGSIKDDPELRQSSIQHYLKAAELYNTHGPDSQLAADQVENLSKLYRNIGTIWISIPTPDGALAVKYLELADQTLRLDRWHVYARKAEAYRLIGDEQKCREQATLAFEAIRKIPESSRKNARDKVQSVLDALNDS